MKLNKQKIDEIKNKINKVKEKITSDSKEKVPKRYYALLILMLLLGVVTLTSNIERYNKSKKEDYIEYEYKEQEVDASVVQVQNYQIAQSSISTLEPNITEDDQAIPTISSSSNSSYIMPLDGPVIKEFASKKLVYSETLGMWKTHPGIDIKAKLGDKVKSAGNGKIQEIVQDSFYGNTIKILDEAGYIFVYSNLDNDIELKVGDKVDKGDIIGIVGVSAKGELQEQTHLHFEVIKDKVQVNPEDLIN